MLTAFWVSVAAIAVGEIGDKTQLLALMLAARYRQPWPIVAGILCATLTNHALAGLLGSWVRHAIHPSILRYAIARRSSSLPRGRRFRQARRATRRPRGSAYSR
jgi:putative Ca2+/H+ antiporter (TMEM165/GDT1 family)